MLALRKLVPGPGEPVLSEVPIPVPGPGEVRIAVTAAGICGTDLHLLRDEYAFHPPVTMGHEVAGLVDVVGEGVDGTWIGALVASETASSTCGTCRWCRDGRPMLCASRRSIGSGVDGGFASYIVVPARNLHRVPDSVGLWARFNRALSKAALGDRAGLEAEFELIPLPVRDYIRSRTGLSDTPG